MQGTKIVSGVPAGAIPVSFVRFDSGTGTTLYDWGMELAQGELTAANIATVSVWLNGNEIPVYAEALGKWPDGSARTLYLQASQTGTQDTPLSGHVALTGGFTQARRSYVDQSARWANRTFTLTSAFTSGGTSLAVRNNGPVDVVFGVGAVVYVQNGIKGDYPGYAVTGTPFTVAAGATATLTLSSALNASLDSATPITVVPGGGTFGAQYETPQPYRNGGLPEGVIVSTDPTRLCAATGTGYLMPQSTETVFTENSISSSGITTLFDTYYEMPGLHPTQSAIYERGVLIWHKFCRTGDLRYLKDFCGYTAIKRQDMYPQGWLGASAAWEYENLTKALVYLFRRDTAVGDVVNDSAVNSFGSTVEVEHRETAQRSITKQTAALWMGYGLGPSGVNLANWVATTMVPQYVADEDDGGYSVYMFDGGRPISLAYDVFKADLKFTYPYQTALYLHALQALHDALPASYTTARTSIASRVSSAIDYMLASGLTSTVAGTSGLPSWEYSDVEVYLRNTGLSFAVEVMSSYTAGQSTISLRNNDAAAKALSGTGRSLVFGAEAVETTAVVTWAANETRTITLTTPFAAGLSAGTIGLAWQPGALAVSSGWNADPTPVLNGFWPHVLAWDWWINGDTTSRDKAKQFFCSLALPVANGGSDLAFSGKHFSEAFHLSQQTPAILAKRA